MTQQPLATVNGKNIYASDLDALVQQLPPQQAMQFQSREGRKALLDELIAQELMHQEALDQGYDKSEEFQEILKDAKEKLLKSSSIANFMKNIDVPEEEVKKYYDENPDQFIAPDAVRASHILVPSEEQAKQITQEIKEGKKTFEQAAKDYSSCPSKDNGGDLNYFHRGQMVPEFEQAAFNLEPGQMTDEPVKTQFGYHIIKTTDKKSGEKIPYDIVKDSAKHFLTAQKQDTEFKKHIEDLKQKYPVDVNKALV